MRKAYYFLTLICSMAFLQSGAQVYEQITALTGTQVTPNGITVNVTRSSPAPNTNTQCGAGPYQIGRNYSDWYEYTFPGDITHARLEMIKIHKDDTVMIDINGAPYTVTAGNVTAFAGTCNPPYTSGAITHPNGGIGTSFAGSLGEAATITLQLTPLTMNKIRVTHARAASNIIASDVTYSLFVADDSCSLGFEITVDSPACSGRDLHFEATQFPNTQYSWTTLGVPIPPTWTPNTFVYNPTIVNANQGQSGSYIATALRGACVYTDTVTVLVSQSPSLGSVRQTGPVCPGENDTLFLPNISLPVGGWAVAYGTFPNDTFDANQGYILELEAISAGQANLAYNIYAVDINGCYSDTAIFYPKIRPDVKADFVIDTLLEGCFQDTVIYKNLSTTDSGKIFSYWDFDDLTNPSPVDSTLDSIVHYYKVPIPNWKDSTYYPTLYVTNGRCSDTLTKDLYINHPIKAEFYIAGDGIDSFCQGKQVDFNAEDSSFVKPGTTPEFLWVFRDGDSATTLNVSHTFEKAGVFNTTFILKDYLGCIDSFERIIVSDSAGFINYTTDKESVCVGEEIVFTGEYSTFAYVSAVWDFGDGVSIPDSTKLRHSYNRPGTYDVTFAVDYRICPDANITLQFTVKPTPQVYLGQDTAICLNGDKIHVEDMNQASNPPGTKYVWNTPTRNTTPGLDIFHHGIYSLTADNDGCTSSDTLVVSKNCYINIPNVFTPNGDGLGDYFLPRQTLGRNIMDFEMHIYNRWGQKVFETTSNNGRGWDGKLNGDDQPTGVYIYVIDVSFGNNVTERYQGNVTLLR